MSHGRKGKRSRLNWSCLIHLPIKTAGAMIYYEVSARDLSGPNLDAQYHRFALSAHELVTSTTSKRLRPRAGV